MEQGVIWELSVSATQWSSMKPVEWDAIQSQVGAHKKSYAIVYEHCCMVRDFLLNSFFLLRRLKEKTPNPTWTIHFFFFYTFILNEKFMNM